MGLTTAGLTALLDDGDDSVVWAAVGDGPAAADQVSAARVQIVWGGPSSGALTAANAPLAFTGTPSGTADHLLLFSAPTAGTFYGFVELTGDVLFNADGDFRIDAITLTGSAPGDPPAAPLVPFDLGTEVGPPDGTEFTASSGTGTSDGIEDFLLTHPVTGEESLLEDMVVFRHRSWASTVSVPTLAPGVRYLFDECHFPVELENFCVDAEGADANATDDMMLPSVVFNRCSFDGNDTTGKCVVGGHMWFIDCDLRGVEDGWSGAYWSVMIGSNVLASTDGGPDPHSDGIQSAGIGELLIYNSYLDAGDASESANAPLRVGTEFSAVANVGVYYSGLAGSQHGLQFRGDAGAGDITGVTIIGNRWVDEPIYGPADFEEVTDVTWEDNRDVNGDLIPSPV